LDSGAFASCTSSKVYSGLAEGAHHFEVKATAGGLEDPSPATFDWTVDIIPAKPTITASNPATTGATPTRQRRPTLSVSADGLQTTIRVFRDSCNNAAVQELSSTATSASVALGAGVQAAADGTTVYFAETVDATGNHSGCGAGFNYVTDNT